MPELDEAKVVQLDLDAVRRETVVTNVTSALEEPARFARLDGLLFYDCELGQIFQVEEVVLMQVWRANRHMRSTGTKVVDAIPGASTIFDVGEAEASGGLPLAALVELEGALDDWALWCDDLARAPRRRLRVV